MQHKILNITRLHYKILGYTSQYYQIHIERFQTRITSYLTYITMNAQSQEIQYTKHDNTNHVKTAQHAAQKFKQ